MRALGIPISKDGQEMREGRGKPDQSRVPEDKRGVVGDQGRSFTTANQTQGAGPGLHC
jgi:hypothetical protein